jgi:FixJ family two-component response regulator
MDPVVFVVDDEAEVRDSLARLLRSAGWAVETFASAHEFLLQPLDERPGCLLLDVNMPAMTGPELHDLLHERHVDLPIVYLTGRSSVSIGVRAMKQGAFDFLEKPVDGDLLLAAIEAAVARHRVQLARNSRIGDITRRLAHLSAREREVMDHVIAGRLNKQIAADLGIAEKTVKVHRGRVMAKMRVRSVAELVRQVEEALAASPAAPAAH